MQPSIRVTNNHYYYYYFFLFLGTDSRIERGRATPLLLPVSPSPPSTSLTRDCAMSPSSLLFSPRNVTKDKDKDKEGGGCWSLVPSPPFPARTRSQEAEAEAEGRRGSVSLYSPSPLFSLLLCLQISSKNKIKCGGRGGIKIARKKRRVQGGGGTNISILFHYGMCMHIYGILYIYIYNV